MNLLAAEAAAWDAETLICTDVKIYRAPHSFVSLLDSFWPGYVKGMQAKFVGATVLPYPLAVYQKFFPDMTTEEIFYYQFLEIEKHPLLLQAAPKKHLRGTLFMTGAWNNIPEGVLDDFYINRFALHKYGEGSVVIDPNALGYVIPRQSFLDHFSAKAQRSIPGGIELDRRFPELAEAGQKHLRTRLGSQELEAVASTSPQLYALFRARKIFLRLERELITGPDRAPETLEQMSATLLETGLNPLTNPFFGMNHFTDLALDNPFNAAMALLIRHEADISRTLANGSNPLFGPRQARYRSLLPLD